jgi:hypothetical protein
VVVREGCGSEEGELVVREGLSSKLLVLIVREDADWEGRGVSSNGCDDKRFRWQG